MLILLYWLPPSDHATKQARIVHAPTDVNLLNDLLSVANIGGIHKGERQEQKAQVSKKYERGDAQLLLVNNSIVNSLAMERAALSTAF